MTLEDFRTSLDGEAPPPGLSPALEALWYAGRSGRDDWRRAHTIAQDDDSKAGAWVHAYLHREEGDLNNAAYWYARAGRSRADGPLDDEWSAITEALLARET